MIANMSFA